MSNDDVKNNNNRATPPPSTSEEEEQMIRSIDQELTQVERGLESSPRSRQRQSAAGSRAAFNSIQSALSDIRSHLNEAMGDHQGSATNNRLSQLSQRLRTAEQAHSSRIPLDMIRGSAETGTSSDDHLQRQRQSTRDRLLSSLRSTAGAMTAGLSRSKSEGDKHQQQHDSKAHDEDDHDNVKMEIADSRPSSATTTADRDRRAEFAQQHPSRRSSVLLASRTRAARAEGFQVDLDLHENGAGLLLSAVGEGTEQEEQQEVQEDDAMPEKDVSKMDLDEPEQQMLLSRRQKLFVSSGSLSGSLHLSQPTNNKKAANESLVFSWGCGVQSLHDDSNDKTVEQAQVTQDSRIGRIGAPAVLSVATSQNHTACATSQGQVMTCGWNKEGAVDPDRKDEERIPRPALLESLGTTRIVQVSCGYDHTAALSDNGSVLTWGSNKEGQLGHRPAGQSSSHTASTFARPRGMLLSGGKRAAAVACGHGFTLVLTTRMSLLACGVPEIAGYHKEDNHHIPSPIPAIEGLPLVCVAAGNRHAVVITVHGSAFAWGHNESGCCGRPYPENVTLPVPFHLPESSQTPPKDGPKPFPNWALWDGKAVTIADDVAVTHAACGDQHTVLVTRSGRLLCCGNNDMGQLGLSTKESATSLKSVEHPEKSIGRRFMTAEAGNTHTLLLDSVGDVWQMGQGMSLSGPQRVLTGKGVLTIAAGGNESIAVAAAGGGALRRQFSVSLQDIALEGSLIAESMEELLETVGQEMDEDGVDVSPAGIELASRTEELLSQPAVLNSLFLDPSELDQIYKKLVSTGGTKFQQAIASAIERGVKIGLEKLRPDRARMMYPETVRCLLLYIQFFDRDTCETDIVFDRFGDCISALCETILSLPFEGYKALLTWATSIYYPEDMFVRMLVRPLLGQLETGLRVDIDENGVQHGHLSRRAIPVIVAVLRWLYSASERVDKIASPEDFYSEGISKVPVETLYDDLAKLKKASKGQRAVNFFLCANPFLLSPQTKRNLLQVENQVEMIKVASENITFDAQEGAFTIDPFFVLEIEREHLLHQTLAKIKKARPSDLRKKLRVAFKGEDGVDAGGVTKEFFQLLSEALFDVNSGMWTDRFGTEVTWFNSDCTWDQENFELTGVLFGLAVYNGVLLDVHFPTAVYRKLLGMSLGLEDLVDKELMKGLQQLLDYEGDDVEYIFCLTFEVTWSNLGQEQKLELKPGGSDIAVTSDNREEYVLLYVKWLLVDSIQPQWDAFEKGIRRVMESASLDLFRPEELELLVVGTPELDFEALETNTEYEGGYDKDSAVIKNFWRFIKGSPLESQLKFLRFATGSSKAPIGGLGEMPFKVQRAGPDSPQLPTSHTCFNTLLLPDYGEDYDKLSRLLGRAIIECEGFGLE